MTADPSIRNVDQHTLDHEILVDALRAALPTEPAAFYAAEGGLAGTEHAEIDGDHPRSSFVSIDIPTQTAHLYPKGAN